MTKDEIEELKALEREATPGPWEQIEASPMVARRTDERLTGDEVDHSAFWVEGEERRHDVDLADAAFIPVARNALPRLLEERERLLFGLRGARDRLRELGTCVMDAALLDRLDAHIAFAEAPASKGQVCGFVVSEDWRAKWTCGKPAGHEGPHSGKEGT